MKNAFTATVVAIACLLILAAISAAPRAPRPAAARQDEKRSIPTVQNLRVEPEPAPRTSTNSRPKPIPTPTPTPKYQRENNYSGDIPEAYGPGQKGQITW